jgi:hypothetical protein
LARSRERRALVIERAGRRHVYPADAPFQFRQPLPDPVLLRHVLEDALSVLGYLFGEVLARGDGK